MLYFLLSLVILLHHTVNTEAVTETLDKMYEDLKNNQSSCSLLDQSTEDHFQKLCKDRKSPETEIDDDKIKFDFLPYLCYTVLHNLRSACNHSAQNFTEFVPQQDASQFCNLPPQIDIKENCTAWLEDQAKAHTDCALVSQVVSVVLSKKTCHDYCIKEDKIDPLCQDLIRSSVILAELSNRSPPAAPQSLAKASPAATQQKKEPETKEETKEATKAETLTSSATSINSSVTSPVIKPQEGEAESKEKKEETSDGKNVKKDNQVEEKASEAAKEIEEIEITKAIATDSPTVPETDPPKEKVEAKVEKVSEPQEQESSGVISEETNSVAQSNFFSYFILLSITAILAYLVFHNKQKVSDG